MTNDAKTPVPEPEISISVGGDDAAADRPLGGERFGKYQLVRELAAGGMAQIFLAVYQGLEGFNRVVAVKRVLPHMTTPEFVQMFLDEARLAARLEHPNIVRTYEFGVEAGRYFMVMEYLAGEDLNAVLSRAAKTNHRLSIPFIIDVVSRVCAGLHFAHELGDVDGRPLGLVHRDVTPANIIITYFGEVKLIDFGVAKSASNVGQTRAGMLKGKISYMSPEQLRSRGIDRRSDVFSAGVVLWELLTGVRLFARDSDAATLYAIIDDPVPSVRTHRPEVPEELARIVDRALARAPEERWATAEEMQLALEAVLASRGAELSGSAAMTTTASGESGARRLARELELLFGAERTAAKRALGQGRALSSHIAVLARRPSELVSGPVGTFSESVSEAVTSHSHALDAVAPVAEPRPRTKLIAALAVIAAVLAGVVTYGLARRDTAEPVAQRPVAATLTITSRPTGAAIYVAGEPTGLTTPATLVNVEPGRVVLRLAFPGYQTAEATIAVAPGSKLIQNIELVAQPGAGRLVMADLPRGAVVSVDGEDHPAGEVIPVTTGRHTVRVTLDGQTLVEQSLETAAGDQIWELAGHELRRRPPAPEDRP